MRAEPQAVLQPSRQSMPDNGMLQRAAIDEAPVNNVPPIVHEVLRSSGQPLDAETRAFFEPRLGHDFSSVQVHTNARAAESAQEVNAQAYTVGNDIIFGTGFYTPQDKQGRELIAHELTHVVGQQRLTDPVLQRQVKAPGTQPVKPGTDLVKQYLSDAQSATNYTRQVLQIGMGNWWNRPYDPRFLQRVDDWAQLSPLVAEIVPELLLSVMRVVSDKGWLGGESMEEIQAQDKWISEQVEQLKIRQKKEGLGSRTFDLMIKGLKEERNTLQKKYIDKTAETGKTIAIGNCSEHAAIAYQYLRLTPSRPIEYVFKSDHAFVLIGRTTGLISKSFSWNPETVVCDSYYGENYVVSNGELHKQQTGVTKSWGRIE
jgi:hypothetical protein